MAKFLNKLNLPLIDNQPGAMNLGDVWYDYTNDVVKYKGAGNYPLLMNSAAPLSDYTLAKWYQTQAGVSGTIAAANNRAYAVPFVMTKRGTISGVACEITTAFATTAGTLRVAIYDDGGGRAPQFKTFEYPTVAATVGVKTFTAAVGYAHAPGTYWLVAAIQGASGTAGNWRTVTGIHEMLGDGAATPNFNTAYNTYYSDTGFSGTFPGGFGTVAGFVGGPRFAIRFSS